MKENILAQIKQSGMEYCLKQVITKYPPGFIEFSGGVNDAATPEKERHDVKKLYSMMIDVMNGYPANVKKQIFCIRFYGNLLLLQLSKYPFFL